MLSRGASSIKLARRGRRGAKLVVSEGRGGLKAVVNASCTPLAAPSRPPHAQPTGSGRPPGAGVGAALIATAFARGTPRPPAPMRHQIAGQLRTKVPRLIALMDEVEHSVLAYMGFPAAHWTKLHSTDPIERLNGATHRGRQNIPQRSRHHRLVGTILLERGRSRDQAAHRGSLINTGQTTAGERDRPAAPTRPTAGHDRRNAISRPRRQFFDSRRGRLAL
jgi:hypothetical protein